MTKKLGKRNKSGKGEPRKQSNKKRFGKFHGQKNSALNKNSNSSTNPDRKIPKGSEGFYRTKATIKRLNMYKDKPDLEARKKVPTKPARIEPDRRWFNNVRVTDQKTLATLRKEIENQSHDTYSMLLKKRKIPMSLITPMKEESKVNRQVESFQDTFGKNARRTKPTLNAFNLSDYAKQAEEKIVNYSQDKDSDFKKLEEIDFKQGANEKFMNAGQSKRIYRELHKVIDSSDVLCVVLDARDPLGTRSYYVENFIKKNAPHKHIIFVLNKCDLVPTWATAAWIKHLSKEHPTLAFHASINNPFGKAALFQLLRQFDILHRDKKNISIGFVGYPNVGKSSIINTLKKKSVCRAASIPGETKVWQYVALTKRIYLIDCPGVVYDLGDSDSDKVLKSVIRAEKLDDPTVHIPSLLEKAEKKYLQQIYGVEDWTDYEDFVGQVAIKYGKILKGAEPNLKAMAKIILMDWQRGKIPFFVKPPLSDAEMKAVLNEVNGEIENQNEKYGLKQDLKDLYNTHKILDQE